MAPDYYEEWDDVGDGVGIFGIRGRVAPNDQGFGAKLPCHSHGHARMDAETARFVTAGGDNAAVAGTADEQGLSV